MPLTKTQISNLSLGMVGDQRITDFDTDEGDNAQALRDAWDFSAEFTLSKHKWTFAKAQEKLARLGGVPVARYEFEYQLPSLFLAYIVVSDNETLSPPAVENDFRIIGGTLITNFVDVYMEYIKNITNTGLWPAHFTDAFAVKLASMIAQRIQGSVGTRRSLESAFEDRIRAARATDSQNQPILAPYQSRWRQSRFGRRI